MRWLSSDSRARCSHRIIIVRGGCGRVPALSVPRETGSTRGTRSPPQGQDRLTGPALVAAALFCSVFVAAMVRGDESEGSSLVRHSVSDGEAVPPSYPPRSSFSSGRARHRRPPIPRRRHPAAQGDVIPAAATEDDVIIVGEKTWNSNPRDSSSSSSSSSFAEMIVLPVETLSKSGSNCSVHPRGDCADPVNDSTPNRRRTRRKEEEEDYPPLGNTDPDPSNDEGDDDDRPSHKPCLNNLLDPVSVDEACLTPDHHPPLCHRSFRFAFCSHLRVADAVANRTDGGGCWREDGASEAECRVCLARLYERDAAANAMYALFEDVLAKFDCDDRYSTVSGCSDCKIAYRHWVCSITIPYYNDGAELIEPCGHYSETVEQRCPYLSPHSQYQYAGEPVFSSVHTKIEETNLRLCHYLCRDHSNNTQIEVRYAISNRLRVTATTRPAASVS